MDDPLTVTNNPHFLSDYSTPPLCCMWYTNTMASTTTPTIPNNSHILRKRTTTPIFRTVIPKRLAFISQKNNPKNKHARRCRVDRLGALLDLGCVAYLVEIRHKVPPILKAFAERAGQELPYYKNKCYLGAAEAPQAPISIGAPKLNTNKSNFLSCVK